MEPGLIIREKAKAERHLAELKLRQLLGGAGASPSASGSLAQAEDIEGDIKKLEDLIANYRDALSGTAGQ